MMRGYSKKLYFFLFVLLVKLALNTVYAQRQSSVDVTVTEFLKNLSSYNPINPFLEKDVARYTPRGPEIRRISFPVDKTIMVKKPSRFTVVLEVPPKEGTSIQSFVIRPRDSCVIPLGWYAYKDEADNIQRVIAVMNFSEECEKSDGQKMIFDIECDACDLEQARLTHKKENVELHDIKKWQFYDNFWSREPQPATFVFPNEKTAVIAGRRRWKLTTEARNLCMGPFEAGITFYLESAAETHFHWKVSNSDEKYKALAGAHGKHTVVTWEPKEKWAFCHDLDALISLVVRCNNCILDEFNVMSYLLTKPDVPQGTSAVTAIVSGFWRDGGICTIASGGFATPENNDKVRLWFSSTVPGDNLPAQGQNVPCPLELGERQKVVGDWENELSLSLGSLARSFFNVPKCVCEGLKGRIYRPLEWRPKMSDADSDGSSFKSKYYGPIAHYPKKPYTRFFVNEQHIRARQAIVYSGQWHLAANINAPQVRCAREELTVQFRLHADGPISKALPAHQYSGRVIAHYHSWDQVLEVTLIPLSGLQGNCTTRIPEALAILVHCQDCSTVSATVTFIPGPAFEDILPHPLYEQEKRTVFARPQAFRLAAKVDQAVVARGNATPFIAVLNFPPFTGGSINHFAVRPRSLLTDKNIWYDYEENGIKKVAVALSYPEIWDENELPLLVVDVECNGCDLSKAHVTYKYTDVHFREIEARYNFHKFLKRRPEKGVPVNGSRREPCRPGLYCHEFKVAAEEICGFPFDGVMGFITRTAFQKENFYWQVSGSNRYEAEIGMSPEGRGIVSWKPSDSEEICKNSKGTISLQLTCKSCFHNFDFQVYFPREHEVPQGASTKVLSELVPTWDLREDACYFRVMNDTPSLAVGDIPKIWWTPTDACDVPIYKSEATFQVLDLLNRFWNKRRLVRYWEEKIAERPIPDFTQKFDRLPKCICDTVKGRLYRLVDAGPIPA